VELVRVQRRAGKEPCDAAAQRDEKTENHADDPGTRERGPRILAR
jgi:hypothetical protein